MAGFLGWVRTVGGEGDVAAALQCLRHHVSFQSMVLAGDSQAGAGVIFRQSNPPEVFEDPGRDLVVAVLGAVLDRGVTGWQRLSAQRLADSYSKRGLSAVTGRDGAYVMVIWDGRAGELHVMNDRVGSLPVVYAKVEDGIAFAPEAKALFRLLPLAPRIDFTGMISFLNMGYPIGTYTMFEGVRLLAPAHVLSLDLRKGVLRQERTWVQRFEPDRRLSLDSAADMLFEAILEAHRAPLGRDGDAPWIALTGGYDSRVVLSALRQVGKLPEQAATWGATDQVPNSDPIVARALADAVGIPHRFLAYDSADVAAHAREWVLTSELASDNRGYFAAGSTFLYAALADMPDAFYIGDVVIASGGLPRSVDEALEMVTKVPADGIIAPLRRVLRPDARSAVSDAFQREARLIVETSSSSRPEDVQDHLWTQIYNFRWLFSAGFYKEPMLTAWRPMLLGNVYEVLAQIPAELRVYRRVYVHMLRRHLPEFGAWPRAEGNSLIDWRYDSRTVPSLKRLLVSKTTPGAVASSPFGSLVDQQALSGFVSDFLAEQPPPARRQADFSGWVGLRRRFAAAPFIGEALKLGHVLLRELGVRPNPAVSSVRFVFRLAVLRVLCDCIDEGAFDDGRWSAGV